MLCSFRRGLATLILAGLLLPAGAAAQSSRQRAAALLQEGNALHDRGDFAGALDRYQRARDLFPSYKIELNLGLTLEAMGRTPLAAERFERFLAGAARETSPADRPMIALARQKLAALQARLARLTLSCPVAGARVEVDGAFAGTTPLPERLYLLPGQHELRVTAPGRAAFARQLELAAGDHRYLAVSLLATAALAHSAAPQPRTDDAHARPGPLYRRWWFWSLIGAAVVGGTVGTIVGVTQSRDTRLPRGELGDFDWNSTP